MKTILIVKLNFRMCSGCFVVIYLLNLRQWKYIHTVKDAQVWENRPQRNMRNLLGWHVALMITGVFVYQNALSKMFKMSELYYVSWLCLNRIDLSTLYLSNEFFVCLVYPFLVWSCSFRFIYQLLLCIFLSNVVIILILMIFTNFRLLTLLLYAESLLVIKSLP